MRRFRFPRFHRIHLIPPGFLVAAVVLGGPGLSAQAGDDEIRPKDKILLANGNQLIGEILTPNYETALVIQVKSAGATLAIKREDIQSIVPRRSPADVYSEKEQRLRQLRDPAERAQAEFHLGLWAKKPLAVLGGGKPQEDKALGHLLNAVEIHPALHEAYPHILSIFAQRGSLEGLGEEEVEHEIRLGLLARAGGYESPEIDFRTGYLLAHQLKEPTEALVYLERFVKSGHDNRAQLKEARAQLVELYRQQGTPEKSFPLFEALVVTPETDPANFEPFFELAKLHLQSGSEAGVAKARDYLAKAQAIQPEFVEILGYLAAMDYLAGKPALAEKHLKNWLSKDPGNYTATLDLALVWVQLGRYARAEASLRSLLPEADEKEKARIQLGLGSIAEGRGKDAGAVEAYREALVADPESVEAKVALGFALARLGQTEEARGIAETLLQAGRDNIKVFAICSQLLGDLELAAGHAGAALIQLQRAVEVESNSPLLLARTGIILLREEKLERGYELLHRAQDPGGADNLETLNALGYYHYARGENAVAEGHFKKVVASTLSRTAQEKEFAARHTAERAYALRALDLINDLRLLEVWLADFSGPDAPTLNGWSETERFGVQITRQNSHVTLSGTQQGEPEGITMALLERPVEAATFDRVAMRARVVSGDLRLGLRLQGGAARGGAAAGLVFFRDLDGVLKFQVQTTRGDWELGAPSEDRDPQSGKLVYSGTTKWPQDDAFHTLEIRRAKSGGRKSAAAAGAGFDLVFDGEPVAWNVTVGGMGGRSYDVGFSGQTNAVDKSYNAIVDSFKIYRQKPLRERRVQR